MLHHCQGALDIHGSEILPLSSCELCGFIRGSPPYVSHHLQQIWFLGLRGCI